MLIYKPQNTVIFDILRNLLTHTFYILHIWHKPCQDYMLIHEHLLWGIWLYTVFKDWTWKLNTILSITYIDAQYQCKWFATTSAHRHVNNFWQSHSIIGRLGMLSYSAIMRIAISLSLPLSQKLTHSHIVQKFNRNTDLSHQLCPLCQLDSCPSFS